MITARNHLRAKAFFFIAIVVTRQNDGSDVLATYPYALAGSAGICEGSMMQNVVPLWPDAVVLSKVRVPP